MFANTVFISDLAGNTGHNSRDMTSVVRTPGANPALRLRRCQLPLYLRLGPSRLGTKDGKQINKGRTGNNSGSEHRGRSAEATGIPLRSHSRIGRNWPCMAKSYHQVSPLEQRVLILSAGTSLLGPSVLPPVTDEPLGLSGDITNFTR